LQLLLLDGGTLRLNLGLGVLSLNCCGHQGLGAFQLRIDGLCALRVTSADDLDCRVYLIGRDVEG
jgi:hypothetical protein